MEVLSSWWGGSKTTEGVPPADQSTETPEVAKEVEDSSENDSIAKDSNTISTEAAVNTARDIGIPEPLDIQQKVVQSPELPPFIRNGRHQKSETFYIKVGNYLYNFAKVGTQKVSETATKTASVIQKTVEERVTLVGDFQKEQNKFIQEKHSKRSEAAVPPWVGYNEEKQMKEQILALSQDKRNFLRNPPAGVQFNFDFNTSYPIAMATLQEDPNLQKMRFALVPSKIAEEHFWKNYFYRVSLIKQSSQLTSLAASSGSETKSEQASRSGSDSESSKQDQEEKKIADMDAPEDDIGGDLPVDSPGEGEFISDDFQSVLDKEDVMKGMEQLGMDSKDTDVTDDDQVPEWEKELQQELSDYEVVGDAAVGDEEWEQEINDMLEAEAAAEKS